MEKTNSLLTAFDYQGAIKHFSTSRRTFTFTDETNAAVKNIIASVQQNGDQAVLDFTKKFDQVVFKTDQIKISEKELQLSAEKLDPSLKKAIDNAKSRIETFHRHQKKDSWYFNDNGSILGQSINPLESVGLYIPGGKAAYPSTVLMNAIPALLAGVKRIVLCSPPREKGSIPPSVLYAAHICGITEVFRIGGAQSIAAMAIGTETIQPVDKICGPGNKYVAEAKRLLFGLIDIDMIAGPSEILVYGDASSSPEVITADLFSQAEHDEDAIVVFISETQDLLNAVNDEIEHQLSNVPRADIIRTSLQNNGISILVNNPSEAYAVINLFAPEHLEILAARDTGEILANVHNAGAIFIGSYSPEAMGDYLAGPNHVLPTSGTARFSSPLGVDDFIKKSSIISLTRENFNNLADDVINFSNAEGLHAHARSVSIRKEETKK